MLAHLKILPLGQKKILPLDQKKILPLGHRAQKKETTLQIEVGAQRIVKVVVVEKNCYRLTE